MASDHPENDSETISTLRLLPLQVADAIRHTSDPDALRRFARACATFALTICGVEDPILLHALHLAQGLEGQKQDSEQFIQLRQEVTARVEQLDDLAFQAQEVSDENTGSRDTYLTAFRTARAATSVLCALDRSAAGAAAGACYEALHAADATQTSKALLEIAHRELVV